MSNDSISTQSKGSKFGHVSVDMFTRVRDRTMSISAPLQPEDYVVQPVVDVSPPKWHLAHTTWFFETFVLKQYFRNYTEFHEQYGYIFNSYYESVGERVIRADRGNLSRPTIREIFRYRSHVDAHMRDLLKEKNLPNEALEIIELGLHHEEQHQELLYSDIKYILGHNPLFPAYDIEAQVDQLPAQRQLVWIDVPEEIAEIGYNGDGFCFDNELGRHRVLINAFSISNQLVTYGDYVLFIEAGGYNNFKYWHAEAWDWIKSNRVQSPMYMHQINNKWHRYAMQGLEPLPLDQPALHLSYYEASAYANWAGFRLPTEFEWEVASKLFSWGHCWEWTNSAYLPYPGFKVAPGAIGEYNGKFMVSQMVLRGASRATSPGHSRATYRNFFHPSLQWQFSGIRLAK